MHIERLILYGFRCFAPEGVSIDLEPSLNAFVGDNGSGKTAVLQALQRLFGVTADQRRMRRQDFHVAANEKTAPAQRQVVLEAIIAFPELDQDKDSPTVPEFFRHMAADDQGRLKCRLRLQASWTDDGTLDGYTEEKYWAVQTFGAFQDNDLLELKGADRSRIQLFYIPATRDGASQVTALLRGRLWRAINWSEGVREALTGAGDAVNSSFSRESAVSSITEAVTARWRELHSAGTDATPIFRPVDTRWQEFIRRVEVVFHPDEHGRERDLNDLSDGQRSLFHLAIAGATLDIEARLTDENAPKGFVEDGIPLPALTIVALEEPENNLAPFYLSRIIKQIAEVAAKRNAQAIVSSHSPSILARVEPDAVRHFRLDLATRTAVVRPITLPSDVEDASKFVREAVRTYPELYFARYVVLGEGATEEAVLPMLAKARGFPIDRSFVAVVPLGGRHVNHLWKLLSDLKIPYATLLDLDWGRSGGGYGRVKTVCQQLLETGVTGEQLFTTNLDPAGPQVNIAAFDANDPADLEKLQGWVKWLRQFRVYFSEPLDLDFAMLEAYEDAYQVLEAGMKGPSGRGDPREAVLGEDGSPTFYGSDDDELLRWYRYLFLGRGKPSTHVRVLSKLADAVLVEKAPEALAALLQSIQDELQRATVR